uniref:JmjC domain-containing protein n=1 Tax=Eutreptiella gymnastica TaxID=73025 RepID=A0A7S1HUX0_9EUGL
MTHGMMGRRQRFANGARPHVRDPFPLLQKALPEIVDVGKVAEIGVTQTIVRPIQMEDKSDWKLPPTWVQPLLNVRIDARKMLDPRIVRHCMRSQNLQLEGAGVVASYKGVHKEYSENKDHFGEDGYCLPFLDIEVIRNQQTCKVWHDWGTMVESQLGRITGGAGYSDFASLFPPTSGFTAASPQLFLKWAGEEPIRTGWHFEHGCMSSANVNMYTHHPLLEEARRSSVVLWVAARLTDMLRRFSPQEVKENMLRFPHDAKWLQSAGVPVWYTVQRPGELVVSSPGTAHLVVSWGHSAHWTTNINQMHEGWLRACLRVFPAHMQDPTMENHCWNTRGVLPVYRAQREGRADLGLAEEIQKRDAERREWERQHPFIAVTTFTGLQTYGHCPCGMLLDDIGKGSLCWHCVRDLAMHLHPSRLECPSVQGWAALETNLCAMSQYSEEHVGKLSRMACPREYWSSDDEKGPLSGDESPPRPKGRPSTPPDGMPKKRGRRTGKPAGQGYGGLKRDLSHMGERDSDEDVGPKRSCVDDAMKPESAQHYSSDVGSLQFGLPLQSMLDIDAEPRYDDVGTDGSYLVEDGSSIFDPIGAKKPSDPKICTQQLKVGDVKLEAVSVKQEKDGGLQGQLLLPSGTQSHGSGAFSNFESLVPDGEDTAKSNAHGPAISIASAMHSPTTSGASPWFMYSGSGSSSMPQGATTALGVGPSTTALGTGASMPTASSNAHHQEQSGQSPSLLLSFSPFHMSNSYQSFRGNSFFSTGLMGSPSSSPLLGSSSDSDLLNPSPVRLPGSAYSMGLPDGVYGVGQVGNSLSCSSDLPDADPNSPWPPKLDTVYGNLQPAS